jgi:hypothetical protein
MVDGAGLPADRVRVEGPGPEAGPGPLVGGSVVRVERFGAPGPPADGEPPFPARDAGGEVDPEPDEFPGPAFDDVVPWEGATTEVVLGVVAGGVVVGVVWVVVGVVAVMVVVVVVGVVVDEQMEAKLGEVVGGGSVGFALPGSWKRHPWTSPLDTVAKAPVSAYFHLPEVASQ